VNPDDLIITQMGLLLTQLQFARHAFENIERSVSHYAGIAVTLTGGGTALGAPPLQAGALKVYVTNLNELVSGASGGGLGGLIEGLFGGIGRFVGGFLGGVAGGAVGALALPYDLLLLDHMVSTVERILQRFDARSGSGPGQAADAAAQGASTSLTGAQLDQFTTVMRELTNVFSSASSPPEGGQTGLSASGQLWLGVFRELTSVINGLILLVPILMGAIASLLRRLTDIQAAIVGVLAFAIENALVLRGVLLVVMGDTIAMAGDIAARVLGIIATAIDGILGSIIRVIASAMTAAETAIRVLGTGLANTVNGLMTWLRDGLGNFLIFLGNTRVFRVVVHLVEVLPLVLPSLLRLMDRDVSSPDARADLAKLDKAARISFPAITGGAAGGTAGPMASMPDLGALALPPEQAALLQTTLATTGALLRTETTNALRTAQGAVEHIGTSVKKALTDDRAFQADLQARQEQVKDQAGELAKALAPASDLFTAARPRTGLDAIATAYESWLQGGGMAVLMQRITDQLQHTPVSGPAAERSILGRIVDSVLPEPPGATVEVGEVIIELGAPVASPTGALDPTEYAGALAVAAVAAWMRDVPDRGGSIDHPNNVPLLPGATVAPV
jgi:hypothetical protein